MQEKRLYNLLYSLKMLCSFPCLISNGEGGYRYTSGYVHLTVTDNAFGSTAVTLEHNRRLSYLQ